MLELVIGVVLGAAFHEFWTDCFMRAKDKVNQWMSKSEVKTDGETVEGEVVEAVKEAPAS